MEPLIVIISILTISGLAWLIRTYTPFKVCPICTGVALTWLWLLVGMKLNFLPARIATQSVAGGLSTDYFLLTAILMGGTVVGAMSKLEKFIKPDRLLLWKVIFAISGFSMFYGLLANKWLIVLIGLIAAILAIIVFKSKKSADQEIQSEQAKKLEAKMKNCC